MLQPFARVLTGDQTSNMIRKAVQRPHEKRAQLERQIHDVRAAAARGARAPLRAAPPRRGPKLATPPP